MFTTKGVLRCARVIYQEFGTNEEIIPSNWHKASLDSTLGTCVWDIEPQKGPMTLSPPTIFVLLSYLVG